MGLVMGLEWDWNCLLPDFSKNKLDLLCQIHVGSKCPPCSRTAVMGNDGSVVVTDGAVTSIVIVGVASMVLIHWSIRKFSTRNGSVTSMLFLGFYH